MVTVGSVREAHADEHVVPVRILGSRLEAFEAGRNTLGAMFNRTGATGGTEVSEDAHHIAGVGRAAAGQADVVQVAV